MKLIWNPEPLLLFFSASLSSLEQNPAQNQIRLPMSGSVHGIQRDRDREDMGAGAGEDLASSRVL